MNSYLNGLLVGESVEGSRSLEVYLWRALQVPRTFLSISSPSCFCEVNSSLPGCPLLWTSQHTESREHRLKQWMRTSPASFDLTFSGVLKQLESNWSNLFLSSCFLSNITRSTVTHHRDQLRDSYLFIQKSSLASRVWPSYFIEVSIHQAIPELFP